MVSPLDQLRLFRHNSTGQLRWYPLSYLDVPEFAADLVLLGGGGAPIPTVLASVTFNDGTSPLAVNSADATNWTVNTNAPQQGAYSLSRTGSGDAAFRTALTSATYAPTELLPVQVSGWVRMDGVTSPTLVGIVVGSAMTPDSSSGLRLLLDIRQATGGSAAIQIRKGAASTVASGTVTRFPATGEWVKMDIVWEYSGAFTGTVTDASGVVLGSLATNDATVFSGTVGFVSYKENSFDSLLITQGSTTAPPTAIPDIPKDLPLV